MRRDFAVRVSRSNDAVATVEFERGSANFLSEPLISNLVDCFDECARDGRTRAIVLRGAGKHFCAGADFSDPDTVSQASDEHGERHVYDAVADLFATPLPVVAAVRGAAIGGGLGLALACDFRVASRKSRLAAPFSRLALHHGFGLSVTLPSAVGAQRSLELLYTGRRIDGATAYSYGLCDRLVPEAEVLTAALEMADEIASAAPLAVRSIRRTMRRDMLARVTESLAVEKAEQRRLARTADFAEGVRADHERRRPVFHGR